MKIASGKAMFLQIRFIIKSEKKKRPLFNYNKAYA
jgi:hypothetical protein